MKLSRTHGNVIATITVAAALLLTAGPATASETEHEHAADAPVAADDSAQTPEPLPTPPDAPAEVSTDPSIDGESSHNPAMVAPPLYESFLEPTPMSVITGYKLVSVSKVGNYVDRSREIARCIVATTGLSCSINKTSSATRTIDLALGMSRAGVAANLGISDAYSVSVSVTCNSGALRAGQSLVAYSVGTRYTYKVNKITARSGVILSNETSGWRYAFNPSSSSISCKVI